MNPHSLLENYRTTSCKGAAIELIVCADLLMRGFDVYRAVATNSHSDIVAIWGDRVLRIEVKSYAKYSRRPGVDLIAWTDDGAVRYCGKTELLSIPTSISPNLKRDRAELPRREDYQGWLTKSEAADALRVSTKTIEKYVKQGILAQVMCARKDRANIALLNPLSVQGLRRAAAESEPEATHA